ncbi:MAG TPA: hypothetical protein PKV27_09845 [Ilumatobacteraceae bacterium]|nr:hypothetical protein [Ilumatobacteraceae bacterium]
MSGSWLLVDSDDVVGVVVEAAATVVAGEVINDVVGKIAPVAVDPGPLVGPGDVMFGSVGLGGKLVADSSLLARLRRNKPRPVNINNPIKTPANQPGGRPPVEVTGTPVITAGGDGTGGSTAVAAGSAALAVVVVAIAGSTALALGTAGMTRVGSLVGGAVGPVPPGVIAPPQW